jgi:mycothiol synthase
VEEHRTGLRNALEEAGFEARRSFVVMRRGLTELPEQIPLPDGITAVPWSEDIDEGIRDANNESFADHWGSLPMSSDMWVAMYRESKMFRPDLSFAALDGDRVVSFVMTEFDEEDVETRGYVEYYIHRVGTRRSHRGRRIASHLLIKTLEAAAAAGGDTAGLEVDESSHTGATMVYSRLGFEVIERSIHYLKPG